MQYRQLGRSDLTVSRLCLGTMTWGEQNSEAEAFAQIERAKGAGINFLDTAEMYPVPPKAETYATTERYIGNYFKSRGDRADWILASKIAGPGNTIDGVAYTVDGPAAAALTPSTSMSVAAVRVFPPASVISARSSKSEAPAAAV